MLLLLFVMLFSKGISKANTSIEETSTNNENQAQALNTGQVPDNIEYQALLSLYNSTGGNSWSDDTNWLQGTTAADFATWHGITVENGDVSGIDLGRNNLQGSIPAAIADLASLKNLYLHSNKLSGSIPFEIERLDLLVNLYLHSNGLSGTIPQELGNLQSLEILHLSLNAFSGSIPAALGNIKTLKRLYLHRNQLTDSIPAQLGELPVLTHLYLYSNQLTGSIPASIGMLTAAQEILFYENQLSGSLPATFENLKELRILMLSNNNLSGPIPAEVGGMTKLEKLDLDYNEFSGQIPSSLGQLQSLTRLEITSNQLTGPIPASLGNLQTLEFLWLNDNQLSGSIPVELGNLSSLQALSLQGNELTGEIPISAGAFPALQALNLSRNQLTGLIPATIEELTMLQFLDLGSNQFSGAIPAELGTLLKLEDLVLGGNQLSGPIPASLGNLLLLENLKLGVNQLTGTIPAQLGNLSALQFMQLHENQLSGEIPAELGNLTALKALAVQHNLLEGALPASMVTNMQNLRYLNVFENLLTYIPGFASAPNKAILDLRIYNNLLGFSSIEHNLDAAGVPLVARLDYSPQKQTQLYHDSYNRVLYVEVDGSQNQYKWYRDGAVVSGATASELVLTDSDPVSSTYYCEITSGAVPSLTITSTSTFVEKVKYEPIPEDLATNRPNGDVAPGVDTSGRPATETSTANINYVRTYTPRVTITTEAGIGFESPVDQVTISTQYFDGLGRPIQGVSKQASPELQDVVVPIAYDAFGRQEKEYLPYVQGTGGEYRPNALQEQWDFYQGPKEDIASSGYPFTQHAFEPSPLNRVLKTAAPGENWHMGSDKEISFDWRGNTTSLDGEVRVWQVDETDNPPTTSAVYGPNQLYVTTTTDEHGSKVLEYKDKQGLVVLKKVQLAEAPASAASTTDYLWTYYIYDDFSRLRFVVQPQGVKEAAAAGWSISQELVNRFCFRYRYDERGRMIEKKVPGAAPLEMVYNKRDLLVLTRDGNQKAKENPEWSFTKYDGLNRPVLTGILSETTASSRSAMQSQTDADTVLVEARAANAQHLGYTSQAFPDQTYSAAISYLTATYYDDYDLDRDGDEDEYSYQANDLTPESELAQSNRGRVTASKVKVLEDGKWLTTVSFYDQKGRVIQTQSDNHLDGKDISTTLYRNRVNDEVLQVKQEHKKGSEPAVVTYTEYTYDHTGRLIDTYHQVEGSSPILISRNRYNEIGELVNKQLHSVDDSTFLQSVDYRYNIRGWLTSINDVAASTEDDFFSMNLYYDWGFDSVAHNGNIAGIKWKSANDTDTHAYGFVYDKANRLKGADYVAGSAGNWTVNPNRFDVGNTNIDEGINYDLNGNIKILHRNGLVQQGDVEIYDKMDRLAYDYTNGGNQLRNVHEDESNGASNSFGFKQKSGAGTTGQEYFYDANGNMNKDLNKGIKEIKYNHLNLPKEVVKDDDSRIVYTYDAAGIKLRQQVFNGAGEQLKQTDYIGGLVYEDQALQFMQHGEGRVLLGAASADGEPEYQYHMKDHLGNVRLTFTSKPQVDTYMATMETERAAEEESQFLNVKGKPVGKPLDHTHKEGKHDVGAVAEVVRMNGRRGERQGPRKTLAVMAGDTIRARVRAKYLDLRQEQPGLTADMILAALSGAPGYTVTVEGAATRIAVNSTGATALLNPLEEEQQPKAFLSWQFLPANGKKADEDGGFVQVSAAAAISTKMGLGNHEVLEVEYIVKQKGWINLELDMAAEDSYEAETRNIDVYFDDFEVAHHHGYIVQEDSYYPFGLTFNEYKREGGLDNKYLYNDREIQSDLDFNLYDYGARMYDPALGRWSTVDGLSEEYYNSSPYAFVGNNPLVNSEVDGNWFFGLFGSTSEQRQAASAFAEQTGGRVTNYFSSKIGVNYTTVTAQTDEAGEITDFEVTNKNQRFREDGKLDFGSPNLNAAYDEKVSRYVGSLSYPEKVRQGFATEGADFDPLTQLSLGAVALNGLKALQAGSASSRVGAAGAANSGEQLYEIADGVRRAKAAQQVGRSSIEAIDNAGNIIQVPIKNLRSPFKSSIDVSTPLNRLRYDRIYNGYKAGDKLPPIYVNPGSRGVGIDQVILNLK
ncbi:DUF6443 domain-containing protein [Cesiribacter sp. SM1]|uniref:DUF6443 domain-containing protein n=1 Tax=Cesiribacter sp. SM1 TaxID=2861196 RepID=UPI001CD561E9|nr:DUF6443 domain-containing protein [Cesiribacter sp. SM1]